MKRVHSDDDESSVSKKRIVSDEKGHPVANGQDEPESNDQLEAFRKEAIFRRMKHYSREHERSLSRIAELEKRRSTCEAGLAAITACWIQLLTAMRQFAPPKDFPSKPDNSTALFDLRRCLSQDYPSSIESTLEESMVATRNLVSSFVGLEGTSSELLGNEMFLDCQTARTEAAALRAEMEVVRARLEDTEARREAIHADLTASENRCERLLSKTIPDMQPRQHTTERAVAETTEATPQADSPPVPLAPQPNGIVASDATLESLEALYKTQIAELQQEAKGLRDDNFKWKAEANNFSLENITHSVHYKRLMELVAQLNQTTKDQQEKIDRLLKETEELSAHSEQLDNAMAPHAQELSDLKTIVGKRDADIARLRETRDQQLAEINERKQRDAVKFTSLQEFKTLTTSQSERIAVLGSQLRRYKVELAAHAGRQDLMAFFLDGKHEESYVDELKARLQLAESKVDAMTKALPKDQAGRVLGHAETLEKLADVSQRLERYQRVYDDISSLPPEVASLTAQLEAKDAEIQRLSLLNSHREQTEGTLYSEVDKLSAAWEALEKQVNSKVFELANLEEKLSKSGLDRAKSENKYYASMREKEAIEAERRNLARLQEKQARTIEKLLEVEKNLSAQIHGFEKELSLSKRREEVILEETRQRKADLSNTKQQYLDEIKKCSQVQKDLGEELNRVEALKSEIRRKDELLVKTRSELDREIAARNKLESLQGTSTKEMIPRKEYDQAMQLLKCSTCKSDFRTVIITKCLHTFCRPCIDARVQSRQRKCPHCNVAFAGSEVQTLYLQ